MFFYGLSDVGRRRQNNQDSFGYLKIADNAEVFVVCDGMGGANGGNVASEMSVNVFTEYLKNSLGNFVDSKTNLLVLPEDTDSLGPYATTAEFSFFFFKQKTANEIWYGLVGSEMCIRDCFFHAEDGIRFFCLSRGLGDV